MKVVPNIDMVFKPIEWITCKDGKWENRKNEPEAKLVVDELKSILSENYKNNLKQSVGIITLNAPQQDAIEDEIDDRIEKDAEFAELFSEAQNPQGMLSDLPFVKNIEKVQGDERDIIIISVGYAKELKDTQDMISVNFGALNQMGGENRLNVAVTRARKKIIVICSFEPNKIKVDDEKYGSRRLRDYLIYAKSISESNTTEAQKILTSLDQEPDQGTSDGHETVRSTTKVMSLESLIQSKLQELGYTVATRLGNSDYTLDLAVAHPDDPRKYVLGIECDGQSFLSAASVRERDITRQDFLENRGWRLERVWSRNWWRNPERELSRIQQKIEELRRITKPEDDILGLAEEIDVALKSVHSEGIEDKLKELIQKGESYSLEFKASMRKPTADKETVLARLKTDKERAAFEQSIIKALEQEIIKTVAAFMNSDGGILLVGVEDNGTLLGIENDYQTFDEKKNWDEWSQHFVNIIRNHIETYLLTNIRLESVVCAGKTIAFIRVQRSKEPVYVKYSDSKMEFYCRALNTTQALDPKSTNNYIKLHWNDR